MTPSLPRTCSTPELRGLLFGAAETAHLLRCRSLRRLTVAPLRLAIAPPSASHLHHFRSAGFLIDSEKIKAVSRRPFLLSAFCLLISWSGRRGSNPRPTAWKAVTLPTELLPRASETVKNGGEWRIRTSVGRGPADLQSAAFNRSANSPRTRDSWRWSWRRDSNPRPADYKSAALPTELCQRQTTFSKTHQASGSSNAEESRPAEAEEPWVIAKRPNGTQEEAIPRG